MVIVLAIAVSGLALVQRMQARQSADCRVTYVYDGDTVAMDCGSGDRTARVMGLDTPETKRAGCAAEKAKGDQATARLRQMISGGAVTITRHGVDKYRRDLIRLKVNGTDVAGPMIKEGLAVSYDGGQRVDWCARLAG